MKKYAVIVAGGSGIRMGSATPKQFLSLMGQPILFHTISAFTGAFPDIEIILVLPMEHIKKGEEITGKLHFPGTIRLVTGGTTRFLSVKEGLTLVDNDSIVFVHDGVRCLLSQELIFRCYQGAMEKGNAIPAIAATDSIRIETDGHNQWIDRTSVRLIQTPQTFRSTAIKAAFAQTEDINFTDEATVLESTGARIHLVDGEVSNIKITQPQDLIIAREFLKKRTFG